MFAVSKNFTPASETTLQGEQQRYFVFFNLAVALVALTFVELIIIILPFPKALLATALVILSLAKFVGVVWYFMHLRWDKYLLTLLFIMGLTLAGGTVAVLLFLFEPHPVVDAASAPLSMADGHR